MSPEDRERLAAEYAMGLLEGHELAQAERLDRADAAFARAVADWRHRFSELDETAAPQETGPDLWRRIETTLAAPPRIAPAADAREPGWWGSLWGDLAFWRGAAMAGAAAALALAIGLTAALQRAAQTPRFVAVLITEGGTEPAAVVNAFADGRTELVPLRAIEVPADRALQIWTLWDRAVGPRSVGLIASPQTTRLDLASLPRTQPNQLFEITLEPRSGSPTGRPTGPILMKGLTSPTL